MFGQIFAYSAFSNSHFSSPGSSSGLIASTGHSGTQTPQSMAFGGVDDEHVLALVEAVHGAHFDAVHEFAAYAALVDDVGQLRVLSADRRAEFIHGALAVVALWLKMNAEKTTVLRLDRHTEQSALEGRSGSAR